MTTLFKSAAIAVLIWYTAASVGVTTKYAYGALDGVLKVGQIWAYHSRPHESDSRVTILRIDRFEQVTIIHISISGLKMKGPQSIGCCIQHSPLLEAAVLGSVTELVGQTRELPPDQGGYDIWRSKWDKGEAGYFTISIAEIVETIETAINQ